MIIDYLLMGADLSHQATDYLANLLALETLI